MKAKRDKILFVEDDKIDRMSFERYAQESGFPCDYVLAGSVEEARGQLANQSFDAVVTDYILGDGNAFELLEHIGKCPFIIITGAGDQEIAVKAMKQGVSDYLIKDSDGEYLKALPVIVENAVKHRKALKELKKYREHLEELVSSRTAELRKEVEEHRKTEELLRYNINIAQALLDVTTESIVLLNRDGIILAINETGARRLGRSNKDITGKCLYDYLPPEVSASRRQRIEEVISTGAPSRFEDESEEYIYDINLYPITDNKGRVESIASFARDISPVVRLQKEIITISEKERRMIGQDLHDDLGQYLTGVKYMITNLKQKVIHNEPIDIPCLEEISNHIASSIDRVRGMAKGLYPVAIEKNGFLVALEEMCNDIEKIFNISCKIKMEGFVSIENSLKSLHLFYIAQESVNNALKHAGAKNIKITLTGGDSRFSMKIENDISAKKGPVQGTGGIGIDIMKYRSNLIGAFLDIFQDESSFVVHVKVQL